MDYLSSVQTTNFFTREIISHPLAREQANGSAITIFYMSDSTAISDYLGKRDRDRFPLPGVRIGTCPAAERHIDRKGFLVEPGTALWLF